MVERLGGNQTLLRLVSDVTLTELALFLATILRPLWPIGSPLIAEQTQLPLAIYIVVALVWGSAFLLLSAYAPRHQRAVGKVRAILGIITLATIVLAGILYVSFREVSRLQILTFYSLDVVFLIGVRLVVPPGRRSMDQPQCAKRRVLILGTGEAGRDTISTIERHQRDELELVGLLGDGVSPQIEVAGYPVLGRIEEMGYYVESQGIDEVVVALPLDTYDQFFPLMADLLALPARVRIATDHVECALFRAVPQEFAGVPTIALREPTLTTFERRIKRLFDLFVGIAMLVLTLPLWALIAVAICVDSPGPIVYRQQRVGEQGKLFWMHKFRSMVKGAEKQQEDTVRITDDGKLLFKYADDPRVTRVGRFLRRSSLDELPQLLNVLKGEMSLVGPRPELRWIVEQYEPWQWQRLAVPQGLTGWWQVHGRSDKPMHLHTEEDLFYILNYSLWLDIQILGQTVGAVLKGRGAY
jgi:exopolysaccharide biosynthesis polyprenyl glycosylphosphotransferase